MDDFLHLPSPHTTNSKLLTWADSTSAGKVMVILLVPGTNISSKPYSPSPLGLTYEKLNAFGRKKIKAKLHTDIVYGKQNFMITSSLVSSPLESVRVTVTGPTAVVRSNLTLITSSGSF